MTYLKNLEFLCLQVAKLASKWTSYRGSIFDITFYLAQKNLILNMNKTFSYGYLPQSFTSGVGTVCQSIDTK